MLAADNPLTDEHVGAFDIGSRPENEPKLPRMYRRCSAFVKVPDNSCSPIFPSMSGILYEYAGQTDYA